MSDERASFLARWSKRKAEARIGEADVPAEQSPTVPAPALPADEGSERAEVPLEDLPPIESIGASTDLAPWLRKKVPEEWRRAALSRAWAADPAISQFTGLADYDWDWNAPDGVPGFGPLRAADNVAELLAQAIGQSPKKDAPEADETAIASDEAPAVEDAPDPNSAEMPKNASDASVSDESLILEPLVDTAVDRTATIEPRIARSRRGGGALPS